MAYPYGYFTTEEILIEDSQGGDSHLVSAYDIAILLVNLLIFIAGLLGNTLVIICFATRKNLQLPPNLFIINLAIADLTVTSLIPMNLISLLHGPIPYSNVGCQASATAIEMASLMSIFNITAIGFFRFMRIVHPGTKTKVHTWWTCGVVQLVLYVYALLLILPAYFGVGRHVYSEGIHHCILDWHYNLVYTGLFTLLALVTPVNILLYSYTRIYLHVRKVQHHVASNLSSSSKKDIKLAKQFLVIFLVFVACWMPYVVIALADPSEELPQSLYEALNVLVRINSVVNSIIYFYFNQTFRQEVFTLMQVISNNIRGSVTRKWRNKSLSASSG